MNAMQKNCQEVKPQALGIIGEDHLHRWMDDHFEVGASFEYKRIMGDCGGLPYVVEAAFGIMGVEGAETLAETNTLNWSPAITNPWGSWYTSGALLDDHDPVHLFFHLACPRLDFTDRGKTRLRLHDDIQNAMELAFKSVTKQWTAHKKRAIRNAQRQDKELQEMWEAQRQRGMSIRDAAFEVMERAYMKASGDNTLPANARQIMYAARPWVIELTGGKCWRNSSYFTQVLLPTFQDENPKLTGDWDVVYDARGSLFEPHSKVTVPIGTVSVRNYINDWYSSITDDVDWFVTADIGTVGPKNRYGQALFIEKEGFNELLKNVRLAERYDMAIMSTKGMSVTAMRNLVAELSAKDVTIYVLHDFDKSGFSILNTLRTDTRRWSYDQTPNVVDLGLRLEDVAQLESEEVFYNSEVDPRMNLIESGATQEEAEFLRSGGSPRKWTGRRVELNAMTSQQFVDWLEKKLKENGVKKIVPDETELEKAYIGAYKAKKLRDEIQKLILKFDEEIKPPENLRETIKQKISNSTMSWDLAVKQIAAKNA